MLLSWSKTLQKTNKALLLRALWRSVFPRSPQISLRASLDAAYQWICTAQDATPDDGVVAWYDLLRGWQASYPETTGYIIPTLLTYGKLLESKEAVDRALRMANWEVQVQLATGAVRSGTMTADIGPAVFNTGQVLFGWQAAYEFTKESTFARAAQRAADWLVKTQDDDGAWRRDLSLMTRSSVQTYNVRSAWGLALAGQTFDEPKWTQAAVRNADWALQQQIENGWFNCNGFVDHEMPLLHTIAYTLEGILGLGILLKRNEYVEAALTGIRPLFAQYRDSGKLAGRYTGEWRPTVRWRCLTGEAQIALVLLRLARLDSEGQSLAHIALRILEDLARVQCTETTHRECYGALAGSEPIWGAYCSFRYINWAVKFFVDALLLALFDTDVQGSRHPVERNNQTCSR